MSKLEDNLNAFDADYYAEEAGKRLGHLQRIAQEMSGMFYCEFEKTPLLLSIAQLLVTNGYAEWVEGSNEEVFMWKRMSDP